MTTTRRDHYRSTRRFGLVALAWATLALAGCDSRQPRGPGSPGQAAGATAAGRSGGSVVVAAIQYAGQDAWRIDGSCRRLDATCAVVALVRQAAHRGARLVVTPEYGLSLDKPARDPAVGTNPAADGVLPSGSPVVVFSALARELGIYLALALRTQDRNPESGNNQYNAQIAFDPDGKVVAKHHKIVLFAAERARLTAGEEPTTFDTPFGRVGLLICADVYGDPLMHHQLAQKHAADIVAVAAQWTVSRAVNWQAAFARDWGVYVVAANSAPGEGRGGGVFDPSGRMLAVHESAQPGLALAPIAATAAPDR